MENSKIEWTDHTFNPWVGCTKISPACDHCYAEAWDKRYGGDHWGPKAARRRTSAANWKLPLKWNRQAQEQGKRARVFCASLADVFDNRGLDSWRGDLWELIRATPDLDWLLLTKRPQNIRKMLPENWQAGWPNVWLGTTVENQEEAEKRIPALCGIPAARRFLSCEPLLGPVDLRRISVDYGGSMNALMHGRIHWVICGGESGPGARPMHPDWARCLRDQCRAFDAPFFFKQWGHWTPTGSVDTYSHGPDKNQRKFPNADGFSMLADGRICLRDYTVKEHIRRIQAGLATCTRAVEVDRAALNEFINATKDQTRERDNPLGYQWMYGLGKKKAGRELDGRTWDQFPAPVFQGHQCTGIWLNEMEEQKQ